MEINQDRGIKLLGFLFVLITVFYVFYAACSQRALYLDGSFWFIMHLNRFGDNVFEIKSFIEHPRVVVFFLEHLPISITAFLFRDLTDKITYSTIYSFTMFTLPVLGLWWNFELTKRTKQYAVWFFSLFTYACLILLYQIFSVVETTIGLTFQFVLLNYLLGKINYTKSDKIGIFFLLILMFGIYEHTLFLGLIIFAIMFTCLYDEENPKNVLTKIVIGAGSLAASVYNVFFIILSNDEKSDFKRFLGEALDFWQFWNKLNILAVIVTVLLIVGIIYFRKNKPVSKTLIAAFSGIYIYLFLYFSDNLQQFINPIYEQHMRSIPLWVVPMIFAGIFAARLKKFPESKELFAKISVPVLLCGITLTGWQIVETYYWNQNVSFMKENINNCQGALYVPSTEKDKEIASFFNSDLRRYIWNANFVSTALALEPNYEVKKIILHYDEDAVDKSNPSKRAYQFSILDKGIIGMPYSDVINIKNKFWDLSEPAEALDKYNREHSIQTAEKEAEDSINALLEQRKNRK